MYIYNQSIYKMTSICELIKTYNELDLYRIEDSNYKDFVNYLDELVTVTPRPIQKKVKDAILAKINVKGKGGVEKNFTDKSMFVFNLNQLVLNKNKTFSVGVGDYDDFKTIFLYCNKKNKNIFKNITLNKTKFELNFKLISWNILYKLYKEKYANKENIIKNIDDYIKKETPDILFTQESIWNLENKELDYTCINTKYKQSSLSINFKTNTFVPVDTNYIVRGGYNQSIIKNKPATNEVVYLEEIRNNNKLVEDNEKHNKNPNVIRPIIAVRLKHIPTNQLFIFLNLWAPHSKRLIPEDNYTIYLNYLQNMVSKLYQNGDRIIIAGDFNEFYENNKEDRKIIKMEVNKNNNNNNNLNLFLKQTEISCCGFTTIPKDNNTFKELINYNKKILKHPFDLLYDSEEFKSNVSVDTSNKISDHHPIVGIIEFPTIPVSSGGGIKQNKYLKKNKHNNKKFKKTKKFKNLKKTKKSHFFNILN